MDKFKNLEQMGRKLRFDPGQLLNFFRMFLSPVRIKNNSRKNNNHNKQQNESRTLLFHYFLSPLLKYIPKYTNIIKTKTIIIFKNIDNFKKTSLAKKPAKIILEKSKQVSPNFSFCLSVNFITINIIQQLKEFVKFMKNYLFGNVFRILGEIGTVPISM